MFDLVDERAEGGVAQVCVAEVQVGEVVTGRLADGLLKVLLRVDKACYLSDGLRHFFDVNLIEQDGDGTEPVVQRVFAFRGAVYLQEKLLDQVLVGADRVEVEGLDRRGGAFAGDVGGARDACIDGGVVDGEGDDAGVPVALCPGVELFIGLGQFLAEAVGAHVFT